MIHALKSRRSATVTIQGVAREGRRARAESERLNLGQGKTLSELSECLLLLILLGSVRWSLLGLGKLKKGCVKRHV